MAVRSSTVASACTRPQGVVHNDVKLENVVLSSDTNTAQLMDFGLSTLAAADPDDQIASFVGTYAYMAPEVLNQRGRGAAADLWSFGVSLFKMLTGRMPFRHGTLGELIADIESEAYTTVMAEEMASRAYSDGDKEHAEATTTTTTTTTTTFHPRSSSSSSNAGNAGNAAAAASHGGGVHDELDHNGRLRRRAVSASDIARAPWPKELLEKVHAERVRIREAIAAQSADLAETRRERKFAEAAEARTATNPRPKAARHTAKRATMMLQRKKQRSPKLHRTKIQTLSSNTNLPALSRVAGRPFH